jgi:hypothetical protein
MKILERLSLYVPDMAGDTIKDCHMQYLERPSIYVPELAGGIVKDCQMKYHECISLYPAKSGTFLDMRS